MLRSRSSPETSCSSTPAPPRCSCSTTSNRRTRRGFRAIILGGELKAVTEAVVGLAAAQNLNQYNFSKAFIGTNGVSAKYGYTTPDTDEAFLKSAAIDRSFVSYVLADSSKFGKVSTVTFGTLNSSAIITDHLPDQRYAEQTVVKVVGE